MSFAHPVIAAVAGLSIAIPILIHLLLRFRRRPMPWAAMRFLLEAYQKQRRKLRLQQILLLASRCLLLLAAGLAVARPFAGSDSGGAGAQDVYIVVDNSLTSQLRDASGERALDRHIRSAQEMIDSLGAGDRAAVVALGDGSALEVLPPSGDLQGVRTALGRIEATDGRANLEGALERVRASADSGGATRRVVILSEFRRGFFPPNEEPTRIFNETAPVRAHVVGHAPDDGDNVAVVSVEPQRSLVLGGDERETVRVRLRRFGGAVGRESTNVVRASYVGGALGVAPVDAGRAVAEWARGQTEIDVFVSMQAPASVDEPGALVVSVDRDRLSGDDTRRAPVSVSDSVRVGVVDRASSVRSETSVLAASRWIELALQPDRSSHLQPVLLDPSDLDATAVAGLETVIVLRPDLINDAGWDTLSRFVDGGRSAVLCPPPGSAAHAWVESAISVFGLNVGVSGERSEHDPALALRPAGEASADLLRMLGSEIEELTAPVRVFRSLPMTADTEGGDVMLALEDGTPWVVRAATWGDGQVVLLGSAVSLEWTTLPATPLMVPLMQELVREAGGATVRRRSGVAGSAPAVATMTAELRSVAGGDSLVIDATGAWGPVARSGVYLMAGPRGEDLGHTVVNAPADASDTRSVSIDERDAWLSATGLRVETEGPGDGASLGGTEVAALGVSSTLFLLALLLALLESFLARRFSAVGSKV